MINQVNLDFLIIFRFLYLIFKIKHNSDDVWKPADVVDDIRIVVLKDDGETERRYEDDFGWNKKWTDAPYEFHKNPNKEPNSAADSEKHTSWKNYREFVDKWSSLGSKMKIPRWYKFNPEETSGDFYGDDAHNSLKKMNETMFNFLREKEWQERIDAEDTEEKKNKYREISYFVVDCSQLLGIGGEAVVIRKDVAEKVVADKDPDKSDRDFEALKIIPMMKHNFENEETLENMKNRVTDRQEKADIEKEFNEREKRHLQRKQNQKRGWLNQFCKFFQIDIKDFSSLNTLVVHLSYIFSLYKGVT